ncbi:MAG: 2-hydroxy-3-oxopropionate reductase [Oceanospirillaceae bacterium]|nr:2-hydroxy-3-oxopropionate reductase [Oceanospirillaceae bacterium]
MAKVGFIGMGLMGIPMSRRLLLAGHEVTVWNRSPGKTASLIEAGAHAAGSLQDLVDAVDIIMLCISDTQAVRSVVSGSDGLLRFVRSGQVIVDFSSIDPEVTRELAERVQAEGVSWIDAPVSGGVAGAESGQLVIMAGGDAAQLDDLRPVLTAVSQRVTHMGPVGSGQVTKICNQMLVSCNVLVMAEVMALAEKSGVAANCIPSALAGGFADSIPLQLTGPRMADRDFDPVKWHVKTLLKDLDMANVLARNMTSSVPMSGLAAELMRQHAAKGNQDRDPSTLVELYTESTSEA